MENRPNLFDYATSELSQDAFICWLIAWGDSSYQNTDSYLHTVAQKFIHQLIDQNIEITKVKVKRQHQNIDVWVIINDSQVIVIEDKTGSQEHSNQLKRYAEIAQKEYPNKNSLVYFKMEEQGDYSAITDAGYKVFNRQMMLDILQSYFQQTPTEYQNNIITDYHKYLQRLDKDIKSYQNLPFPEWHWYSWQGFYAELQNSIQGDWSYVANPSGGFLGFWWHWKDLVIHQQEVQLYLQLEQEKLVFKLHIPNGKNRSEIRDACREHLYKKAEELNINIRQYGRLGKYMGIAKLNGEYRQTNTSGNLDVSATVDCLKRSMDLLDVAVQELRAFTELCQLIL